MCKKLTLEFFENPDYNNGFDVLKGDELRTYFIWENIQLAFYVDFIYHCGKSGKFYSSMDKEIIYDNDAISLGLPLKIK